jgi:hypothetical protein
MHPQILSWLRDTGKLAVRYILVGFAFVPAGLLYAQLARFGYASVLSMGLCLTAGFVMASFVWNRSAAKQLSSKLPTLSPALAAALSGPTAQSFALAFTISEGPERGRLFEQFVTSQLAGHHGLIVTRIKTQPVDRQRDYIEQSAGAAHAAFSSISS